MTQTLIASPDEHVLWEVQLAFLRREYATRLRRTGVPSHQQMQHICELRTLRDRMANACEAAMKTHRAWNGLGEPGQLAFAMIVEVVIEQGMPIPVREAEHLCAAAVYTFATPGIDHRMSDGARMVDQFIKAGVVHAPYEFSASVATIVPCCLPLEIFDHE